ncbi:galactose mutarotase-like enzyme [Bacillus tianshenii]|uniref:Galactose mutarotase-like enzyme n=2 Tax=Sutcliffiella tianshenii TaxID=1463404 RepID=A0ABS2NV81_9BACI|nr:galactose mutarotase-like enzyme [Bacillus tianshenii]
MTKMENNFVEGLHTYNFYNTTTNSWLTVVPERGGIITELGFAGKELLYLNKDTLYNKDKNVRGGIPILFPISGQLTNGEYTWNDQVYPMSNHGFARNLVWSVLDTNEQHSSITLQLSSNEETRKSFPFDFDVTFTYILKENELVIEQQYRNTSNAPMPIAAGFHPYFKSDIKVFPMATDATKLYDYNDGLVKPYNGMVDLEAKKEAVVLLDAQQNKVEFDSITLTYGQEFRYVMLWTEQENDFVCVEPWMSLTDEFNKKNDLLYIEPGETLNTVFSIAIKST